MIKSTNVSFLDIQYNAKLITTQASTAKVIRLAFPEKSIIPIKCCNARIIRLISKQILAKLAHFDFLEIGGIKYIFPIPKIMYRHRLYCVIENRKFV